jgi:hypothetical protein
MYLDAWVGNGQKLNWWVPYIAGIKQPRDRSSGQCFNVSCYE